MSRENLPGIEEPQNVGEMVFELPGPKPGRGCPELVWAGKRPFTSTRYYPAQFREKYGKEVDGWLNRIYWGDNLQVMSHLLKEFRGKVDLVYIDPPFDSGAAYKKKIELRKPEQNNPKESITRGRLFFEEKQYGDIWAKDEYLQFIYERLIVIRELLSENGVLYAHCDWHKSQYIRSILDEIFGIRNFINEIIWHYTGGGRSKNYFSKKHDTIFVYSKSGSYIFNADDIRVPYKPTSGFAKGGIVSKSGKKFMPNPLGTIPDDVWDIPIINPLSSERLDYPTQKPEALLERIIRASTNPGSLVLDCFMGAGTTQAVAMKLGRRFIGADINLGAIETTIKRLVKIINGKERESRTPPDDGKPLYPGFRVYTVNNYDMFRNELEARELVLKAMEIVPKALTSVFDGEYDGYNVKIMPPNRIATKADLNPIVHGMDYRELNEKLAARPGQAAFRIMLVCMGHVPDLAAQLILEIGEQYKDILDIKVVDILKDKDWDIQFKRAPEAEFALEQNRLVIRQFHPLNLLQKFSGDNVHIDNWRELVESVAIDHNYDGRIFKPQIIDIPDKNSQVKGEYELPPNHGLVRVKITDLLSESLEETVGYSNGGIEEMLF